MKAKAFIINQLNSFIRTINNLRRPSKKQNLKKLLDRNLKVSDFLFRDANVSDIPSLSALQVRTWNETYSNVKHKPSLALREQQWLEQFEKKSDDWFCIIVEKPGGEFVGYAKGIIGKDENGSSCSELNKIYLLSDYQRLGLGRKLFKEVLKRFEDMGFSKMVLFGIPQNPSCYFHEAMNGKKWYTKNGEFQGGYIWEKLKIQN